MSAGEDKGSAAGAAPLVAGQAEPDSLTLKWGTLKAWRFHSPEAHALLKEYCDIGASFSAMQQHDTPRQKEIICALIDAGNFETIFLDWDGKKVSKDEAKRYVMEYGQKSKAAQS